MQENQILSEIEREFGEHFDELPREDIDKAMVRILIRKLIKDRMKIEELELRRKDFRMLALLIVPGLVGVASSLLI